MIPDPPFRSEMARILALRKEELEDRGADYAREWTARLRKHAGAPALFPIQGVALEVAHRAKAPCGMLGNVVVGGGKTLIFALIPQVADLTNPVLFLDPALQAPTANEYWKWSEHYWFEPPKVVPYSWLSKPDGTDLLTRLQPDAILADECQALRNFTAARTKRFIRYMQDNPDTRFFGLSGTLTTTSVKDYAHLCELALRDGSPLPLSDELLKKWAAVLSADGEPSDECYTLLAPLLKWAGDEAKPSGPDRDTPYQRAFALRFRTTPGTVNSEGSSCNARIVVRGHRFAISDTLQEHINTLANRWVLPDETEVVDGLSFHRNLRTLSMGFFYVWEWPEGVVDEEYLAARRGWARESFKWLEYNAHEGCDSPYLLEQAVLSGRFPHLHGTLTAWINQRDKPEPPSVPVWLDYGPILEAISWATSRGQAIIWFQHDAVGKALEGFGIPTFWEGTPDPEKHPIVALSIQVYHRGWNFQAWNEQLVMEPPTSAAIWEQLIGRTHRTGQQAEVVQVHVFQHTWPIRTVFTRAYKRAQYMQNTTKQPQKLLYAELQNISCAPREHS